METFLSITILVFDKYFQEESCLSPVQLPGLIWLEITYSRPYSLECMKLSRSSVSDTRTTDFMDPYCGGTFVFVGDAIFMAQSVSLTPYQPRWASAFGAYLPNVLRKSLMCIFHVSLTLALLNSLPVSYCYFSFYFKNMILFKQTSACIGVHYLKFKLNSQIKRV